MDQEKNIVPTESKMPEFINKEVAIKLLDPEGNVIEKLQNEYSGIVILDHNDKDQIKVVHNAAQAVRQKRIEINKTAKDVKGVVASFQKEFTKQHKSLTNQVNEIYDNLIETRDAAKNKAADEAKAAEMERMNKFNERANAMFEHGYMNNGVQFVVGREIVNAEGLENIPDADFNKILQKGKSAYDDIQRILKEAEQAELLKEKPIPVAPPASNATLVPDFPEGNAAPPVDDLPFGNETIIVPPAPPKEIEVQIGFKNNDVEMENKPLGIEMGFRACQRQIEEMVKDMPPMKRSDVLNNILALNP